MPARVNGSYYVRYVGLYPWSHFEATGTNSLANQLIQESIAGAGAGLVYPNPVTQRSFTVQVTDQSIKKVTVTLTNLYGHIVLRKEANVNEPLQINGSVTTGIYQVTVIAGNKKVMSAKLIIQ